MKSHLFVMGQDRGEIEVADDSLVGRLARGDWAGVGEKASALKEELEALGAKAEVERSAT